MGVMFTIHNLLQHQFTAITTLRLSTIVEKEDQQTAKTQCNIDTHPRSSLPTLNSPNQRSWILALNPTSEELLRVVFLIKVLSYQGTLSLCSTYVGDISLHLLVMYEWYHRQSCTGGLRFATDGFPGGLSNRFRVGH
ncbi:unnamed protein product [Camellia sinensis]